MALLGISAARPAQAAGGYYSGIKGARAEGRAGAVAARADDITAVTYNPAGLAKIGSTLIQVGNRFSYNALSYTRSPTPDYGNAQNGTAPLHTFATVDNQQPWQMLDPLVGIVSNLGLENWGFALAAYSPPGISREDFPVDGGQRYMMVNREAIILNYSASAAFKYRDVFGIGVSLQWIHVPRLTYSLVIDANTFTGLANPVSSSLDMQATATGSDPFTFNAILGAWFRPTPSFEIGISGQVIPADIVTNSELTVKPLSSGFQGGVTLSRNGRPANDVTVSLPLPLLARAGARYRHLEGAREVFDVELDVEYETWSRAERFTLDTNHLRATFQTQSIDIQRIDLEKHWRDTVAVRLGGDYAVAPDALTLRAGAYYETAVADPAYASVDFPSGAQIGAAVGGSLFFGHWELAAAYELRVQPTVTVSEAQGRVYQQVPGSSCAAPYTDPVRCNPNYLGQPSPTVNGGTYTAQSHFVSVDALYRF
jgi:long-chain fatty acid transport protein